MYGRLLINKDVDEKSYNLDISSLNKGTYILRITSSEGESSHKVLLNKYGENIQLE
jgi:hypothetical protein